MDDELKKLIAEADKAIEAHEKVHGKVKRQGLWVAVERMKLIEKKLQKATRHLQLVK